MKFSRAQKDGLSLIEVLVVFALLGILAVTINTVFKSGLGVWVRSEKHIEIYQNVRMVADRLARELPGAYVESGGGFQGIEGGSTTFYSGDFGADYQSTGDPDSIQFVTLIEGRIIEVRYYMKENVLIREQTEGPHDFSGTSDLEESFEYGSRIADLDIIYLDGDASTWTTDGGWATTGELPEAVEITLVGTDNDGNFFPFKMRFYLPNN